MRTLTLSDTELAAVEKATSHMLDGCEWNVTERELAALVRVVRKIGAVLREEPPTVLGLLDDLITRLGSARDELAAQVAALHEGVTQ